jgi:hypothetical protein
MPHVGKTEPGETRKATSPHIIPFASDALYVVPARVVVAMVPVAGAQGSRLSIINQKRT